MLSTSSSSSHPCQRPITPRFRPRAWIKIWKKKIKNFSHPHPAFANKVVARTKRRNKTQCHIFVECEIILFLEKETLKVARELWRLKRWFLNIFDEYFTTYTCLVGAQWVTIFLLPFASSPAEGNIVWCFVTCETFLLLARIGCRLFCAYSNGKIDWASYWIKLGNGKQMIYSTLFDFIANKVEVGLRGLMKIYVTRSLMCETGIRRQKPIFFHKQQHQW